MLYHSSPWNSKHQHLSNEIRVKKNNVTHYLRLVVCDVSQTPVTGPHRHREAHGTCLVLVVTVVMPTGASCLWLVGRGRKPEQEPRCRVRLQMWGIPDPTEPHPGEYKGSFPKPGPSWNDRHHDRERENTRKTSWEERRRRDRRGEDRRGDYRRGEEWRGDERRGLEWSGAHAPSLPRLVYEGSVAG